MRLSWTAPALSDLRRINTYLAHEASRDVAERVLTAIRERGTSLIDFPFAGPRITGSDSRSLRIHGSPYIIVYRITDRAVQILRIQHERQDWRSGR